MPNVNILIATHNGEPVLTRTLEGYVALKMHNADYKLIVVDNNSTDNTLNILHSFQKKLNLSIISEPSPGKNKAMNTGLAALDAEIIVMSDDDSIPHPGFLEAWTSAFQNMPDIDLFGGSIEPLFDVNPPPWMLESQPRFEELYAQRQNIPQGPIGADRIYGPNMAMRASVVRAGLRFDARIGPDASRKKSYAMGSETAFLRSSVAAGFKTGFAPAPTVSHIVRAAHIEPTYIDGRAYRMGRGTAFKHCTDGTYTLTQRALPVRAAGTLKRALNAQIKQLSTKVGTEEQRFHARWEANFYRGYQDEIAQWKAKKAAPKIDTKSLY